MKFKLHIITILLLIGSTHILAQDSSVHSYQINWNGVETLYVDSLGTQFITFEGAHYPAENKLPYFRTKINCQSPSNFDIHITNAQYIPVTEKEKTLIIPSEISDKVTAELKSGKDFISVQLLPFINQNGTLLKLSSFDLELKKSDKPLRVNAVTTKRTYASSSVLAQGRFVKIKVINSGVYKLTYEDLASMGVDPANVKIFGYGGAVLNQDLTEPKPDDLPEVAIWMEKGSDGIFNAGDYILFYAQGVVKWSYDWALSMFTHKNNPYSKYAYYFVSSDAGKGKKITEKTIDIPSSAHIVPVEEFTDYQVHEVESQHLVESGKDFYGETFGETTSYNLPFNFPNPVSTNNAIKTRLDVANIAYSSASFTIDLNGTQPKYLYAAGRVLGGDAYEQAKVASGIFNFTPNYNTNIAFNITYNKPSFSSTACLNYFEVNILRKLKMSGSAMQFQNVNNLNTDNYNQYLLSDVTSGTQIWDITDEQNISQIATTTVDGKMTFTDSGGILKRYVAIDTKAKNSFPTPEIEGSIPNQNLHAISQADMVIITHPLFLAQAQKLAQKHREKDNLTTEVVTTDQVYNEFSSGAPDATAYRWIMKMLYDKATSKADRPKYLLLFGRGSYDNKKLFYNSDNFVLTYQSDNLVSTTLSYVTDDYFAILKDNEGTQVVGDSLSIGVGRLPVASVQDAENVVNKICNYIDNKNKGNWKNQLCFLADDGDKSLHMSQADGIADAVRKRYPAFQVNKIYLDSYVQEVDASGQTYPLAKTHFMNLIRSGQFLIDFTGHAGPTGWTNESMLSLSDVRGLSNQNLPFVMAATCDFLQFDAVDVSGGEHMLLNPIGGCIGIMSAARPVYSSQNRELNKQFCETLFKKQDGQYLRLGDIISTAKNNLGGEINKMCYIFMGDPALRLNYPVPYNVVTDSINKKSQQDCDTLKALSVVTLKGHIADVSNSKISTFNGNINAVVYDKEETITTQDNEKEGAFTYKDRPNVLFSGKADVKDGEFSITFMIPKDIKYNYGTGKINYYASDDKNNAEAQGYFENFLVGGSNKNYTNETDGPEIELYLNSNNFVSGDKVNETPLLLANISDINGVNTVGNGSGIGHDITLTIDQDPKQSYILNDYFQAEVNSYSSGTIRFKMSEMTNGKHTLTIRAWDLLNNSTTKTVDFEVVKGLAPVIFSIRNYPNPVKNNTHIVVEHDRPETILSTIVDIFDISGKKIWSFSQPSADEIKWDLSTNDGNKIKTGVYLYRVTIKTKNSDSYSKTNKMLIIQ